MCLLPPKAPGFSYPGAVLQGLRRRTRRAPLKGTVWITAAPPPETFQQIHDLPDSPRRKVKVYGIEHYVQQIHETADKLLQDHANRGDVKLLSVALRELRYCFKVFANYRDRPQGDRVRLRPAAARRSVVSASRRVQPAHGRGGLHGHHRRRQRHHGSRATSAPAAKTASASTSCSPSSSMPTPSS